MTEPGGEESDENEQLSLHSFIARQRMLVRRRELRRLRWLQRQARARAWELFMEKRHGADFWDLPLEQRRWVESGSSAPVIREESHFS